MERLGGRGARLSISEPLPAVEVLKQVWSGRPEESKTEAHGLPFVGGWIGWLGYEFGRVLEPAAAWRGEPVPPRRDDRGWPLGEWHECPAAYVYDLRTERWWLVGDPEALPKLESAGGAASTPNVGEQGFQIGPLRSGMGRERYVASAARTVEYVRAGDIFQANIAHRLSGSFAGSPRELFLRLAADAAPWYGAYIESAGDRAGVTRAIASISPELFLSVEPVAEGLRVTTRPIKGTRPAETDPSELESSLKDQAELNMIIDLMRNDLGRSCRYGSVRVDEARRIERHGGSRGVLQAVATVSGVLREGVCVADLVAGAFPPGSITGAPKIRAMQIIEELEPVSRGPYCGTIGYVSACGRAAFNVAIRTACVMQGDNGENHGAMRGGGVGGWEGLDYSVGAGIVVESDPQAEWKETLAKAGAIARLSKGIEGSS